MALLDVEDLHVRFGEAVVLRGLDLSVDAGEVVALIGANGAGKSTAVRTIAGVHRPAAGTIAVGGERLEPRGPRGAVERGIVLVPQGRRLFGSMTVRENLLLGAFTRRRRADLDDDLDRMVARFEVLDGLLGVRASALSGGQQQLVALARGLMSDPSVLLMDEPSMGVAPDLLGEVAEALAALAEARVPILLVEQNIDLAAAVATTVVVLAGGRAVYTGPPDLLADQDELSRYFFGDRSGGDPVRR